MRNQNRWPVSFDLARPGRCRTGTGGGSTLDIVEAFTGRPTIPPADRWGPFTDGLDAHERVARCRCLRAVVHLTTGPRGETAARLLRSPSEIRPPSPTPRAPSTRWTPPTSAESGRATPGYPKPYERTAACPCRFQPCHPGAGVLKQLPVPLHDWRLPHGPRFPSPADTRSRAGVPVGSVSAPVSPLRSQGSGSSAKTLWAVRL